MIDAPLALYEATVPADWIDYNGHMTESSYLLLVGNAADAFFRYIGIDEAYRAAGRSLYTAETHLHHLREAALGEAAFELCQPGDDRFLGGIAFDLSGGDARRILHRDGSGHERGGGGL